MTGSGSSPTMPRYSVAELNGAVASLLERGFAPRFLLDATVSRPQLKKGHLWMTLVDGQASISAVVWASQLAKLSFLPADGDGVVVVGKLNFWSSRASLCVQASAACCASLSRCATSWPEKGYWIQRANGPCPPSQAASPC